MQYTACTVGTVQRRRGPADDLDPLDVIARSRNEIGNIESKRGNGRVAVVHECQQHGGVRSTPPAHGVGMLCQPLAGKVDPRDGSHMVERCERGGLVDIASGHDRNRRGCLERGLLDSRRRYDEGVDADCYRHHRNHEPRRARRDVFHSPSGVAQSREDNCVALCGKPREAEAAAEVGAGGRCNYTASAQRLDPRAGDRAPGRRVGYGPGDSVSLPRELPGEEEKENGADR